MIRNMAIGKSENLGFDCIWFDCHQPYGDGIKRVRRNITPEELVQAQKALGNDELENAFCSRIV